MLVSLVCNYSGRLFLVPLQYQNDSVGSQWISLLIFFDIHIVASGYMLVLSTFRVLCFICFFNAWNLFAASIYIHAILLWISSIFFSINISSLVFNSSSVNAVYSHIPVLAKKKNLGAWSAHNFFAIKVHGYEIYFNTRNIKK